MLVKNQYDDGKSVMLCILAAFADMPWGWEKMHCLLLSQFWGSTVLICGCLLSFYLRMNTAMCALCLSMPKHPFLHCGWEMGFFHRFMLLEKTADGPVQIPQLA